MDTRQQDRVLRKIEKAYARAFVVEAQQVYNAPAARMDKSWPNGSGPQHRQIKVKEIKALEGGLRLILARYGSCG